MILQRYGLTYTETIPKNRYSASLFSETRTKNGNKRLLCRFALNSQVFVLSLWHQKNGL